MAKTEDLGKKEAGPIKPFVVAESAVQATNLAKFTPIKRVELELVGYADQDGEERMVKLGTIIANPKDFSTGSTGLNYNGPLADPTSRVTYRINLNMVVQGSGKALAAGA